MITYTELCQEVVQKVLDWQDKENRCEAIVKEDIYPAQKVCSICGFGFSFVGRNRGGVTIVKDMNYKYCPRCGRRIFWEGLNED